MTAPSLAVDPIEFNPGAMAEPGGSGNPGTPFHLGYRPWLDGLRGLAVLAVIAFHLLLFPGGSFGVDVFFVLSGFLITALLIEEWERSGRINLKNFYFRRALRLLPAFYTLLALSFVCTQLFSSTADAIAFRKEMIVAACYVANWPTMHQTILWTLGHTWTLSVEEQFYLLWPIILFGLLRMKVAPRTIILMVCAGILASGAWRTVLFVSRPPPGPDRWPAVFRLYVGLDTRADALLAGCLVGLLAGWNKLPTTRRARGWVRAGALVAVLGVGFMFFRRTFYHNQTYYGLFTAVALMLALILVWLLSDPPRAALRILEFRPLVGVGRISYGLYIYHAPLIHWLKTRLGWDHLGDAALVVGLSFAAALVSYFCVERPCLRLKHRFRAAGAGASMLTLPRGALGDAVPCKTAA